MPLRPSTICDGDDSDLIEVEGWLPEFPFIDRQVADAYTGGRRRMYEVGKGAYVPTLADRTAYTNYFLHSENFGNAAWVASSIGITLGQPGVRSSTSAALMAPSAADSYLYQLFTPASTAVRTVQFWAKAASSPVTLTIFMTRTSDANIAGQKSITIQPGSFQLFTLTCAPLDTTSHFFSWGLGATWSTGETILIDAPCMSVSSVAIPYVPTLGSVRTALLPPIDPDDSFAVQVAEDKPSDVDSGLLRVEKLFLRLPTDQISYEKRAFNRPALHDIVSGGYYAVSFDDMLTSHLFTSRISTSSAPSTPAVPDVVTTASAISLGHYLVSVTGTGGTQTFYTDDSDATIRANIQAALSPVSMPLHPAWTAQDAPIIRDTRSILFGFSSGVTGVQLGGLSTSDANISVKSGGSAAGTPDVVEVALASSNSTTDSTTLPQMVRSFTTGSAHGGAAGSWMAAWNGDKLVGIIKPTAASGSSVTIPAADAPWSVIGLVITHIAFASAAAARYVNGTRACDVKVTRKYWLPGASMLSGGTTLGDGSGIPSVTSYIDPINWLGAIVAGLTYAAIDDSETTSFMGALLVQTIQEVQMADALESRAVGA